MFCFKKDFDIIWDQKEVKLSTKNKKGDYDFEDFTGYIKFYNYECYVQKATFTIHIGDMNYIKKNKHDIMKNRITMFQGIINNGKLRCDVLDNSIVRNGIIFCRVSNNNTINQGFFDCDTWEKGIVNGGEIRCSLWKCGVFNNGKFYGEWLNGHFINGQFYGEWYGGKWKGGYFRGKCFVGDGTFYSIDKF